MRQKSASRTPSADRILLIRPSALGDVCRTVPLVTSLRRAFPDATIDWLVQDSFVAAVEAHPDLTAVVPFPRRAFASLWKPRVAAEALRWARDLRRRRYDLVVDAQGLGRSGLLAWCTRAASRVGFADARELGWLGCTTRVRARATHTVDRMLELLTAIGVEPVDDMRLHLREADAAWWRERRLAIMSKGVAGAAYAVIAPASRWPGKCWPAAHWRELVAALFDRGIEHVVAIGAPDEREQVRAALPESAPRRSLVDLAGSTTVGQTMAVIADSSLVVASDSAPLHMAVGFDRPLVGLFGATDPARVGPYGRLDAVVRAPSAADRPVSFKDTALASPLMALITPIMVIEAVDRELARVEPERAR